MNTARPGSYVVRFWIVLGAFALLRAWFAAGVDLSPDEAYYYAWSTSLQWGYFDHGPLVAWLIRLGTLVAGHTELGVRLGAILCSCLTCWMVFLVVRELVNDERHAFWVALLMCVCPIFAVGAVVHTPDAALAAAWSLAAWFALRAYRAGRMWHWIGLGASAGLAVLAKLTGLFFIVGLALFLFSCQAGRQRLKGPGPAMALLVAAVMAMPMLLWNGTHQGGSLTFQLQHATGNVAFLPAGLLSFLGGQLGVLSPFLFVWVTLFFVFAWRRATRFGRPEAFLLWCLGAPLFFGLLLLSVVHKVEANWPAVAYISALPGAVWAWTGGLWYLRRQRLWYAMTAGLALFISLAIHLQTIQPFLPIDPGRDPTARLRGWSELSAEAAGEAVKLGAGLASEGYAPVSELRFYARQEVVYEPSSTRLSQYDLWPADIRSANLLYLQPLTSPVPPRVCAGARDRWLLDKGLAAKSWRASRYRWWVCEGVNNAGEGQ
ncbi:MAG TPA: glycosyltransferase family 39 protein [Myxococcota bacterium]|nr:glycosyltransferase family 39 protein [Myxococcota bacterium]